MFDAAIVGAGPAGLSAAINLKMRGKDAAWFGSWALSAKVEKSARIANYPGAGLIGGRELNERFREHARQLGLEPIDRMVTAISYSGGRYMLLADNEMYEARALLLATGVANAKGLPGEEALLGRGVSYCATCDGMFYRGKTIAVYCGERRYAHEAQYLAGLAEKLYLFSPDPELSVDAPNVERPGGALAGIVGEGKVEAVSLANGTQIPVDGVFLLRSAISPARLLPGLALDGPHIAVDRRLAANLPGCFAAGDCTGAPYQIAKAVGEGNVAAHALLDYLAEAAAKE